MSETNVENLKRRIGLKIVELADDADALDETGDDRCMHAIESFRKAATEWIYDLLKKSTEYYSTYPLSGIPNPIRYPRLEEEWAGILFREVVEKHIEP